MIEKFILITYTYTAHLSRFPRFVQQLFFSRFPVDFDAQYGKLRVFGVEEFRDALSNRPEIQKYQLLKNIFLNRLYMEFIFNYMEFIFNYMENID